MKMQAQLRDKESSPYAVPLKARLQCKLRRVAGGRHAMGGGQQFAAGAVPQDIMP
jgi:hypothetical protein